MEWEDMTEEELRKHIERKNAKIRDLERRLYECREQHEVILDKKDHQIEKLQEVNEELYEIMKAKNEEITALRKWVCGIFDKLEDIADGDCELIERMEKKRRRMTGE